MDSRTNFVLDLERILELPKEIMDLANLTPEEKAKRHIVIPMCIGHTHTLTPRQFRDLIAFLEGLGVRYTFLLDPKDKESLCAFVKMHEEAIYKIKQKDEDLGINNDKENYTDMEIDNDIHISEEEYRQKKILLISTWRKTEEWLSVSSDYDGFRKSEEKKEVVGTILTKIVTKHIETHPEFQGKETEVAEHFILTTKDYMCWHAKADGTTKVLTTLLYPHSLTELMANGSRNAHRIGSRVEGSVTHKRYQLVLPHQRKTAQHTNKEQQVVNKPKGEGKKRKNRDRYVQVDKNAVKHDLDNNNVINNAIAEPKIGSTVNMINALHGDQQKKPTRNISDPSPITPPVDATSNKQEKGKKNGGDDLRETKSTSDIIKDTNLNSSPCDDSGSEISSMQENLEKKLNDLLRADSKEDQERIKNISKNVCETIFSLVENKKLSLGKIPDKFTEIGTLVQAQILEVIFPTSNKNRTARASAGEEHQQPSSVARNNPLRTTIEGEPGQISFTVNKNPVLRTVSVEAHSVFTRKNKQLSDSPSKRAALSQSGDVQYRHSSPKRG
ncbi:MAG: hypothetical protein EPO11_01255 [Gammaproteobacteria bacterium]|nr:MAG: hypothetical protein EPO11_01255 [Gammaproteobacteria bacterium]